MPYTPTLDMAGKALLQSFGRSEYTLKRPHSGPPNKRYSFNSPNQPPEVKIIATPQGMMSDPDYAKITYEVADPNNPDTYIWLVSEGNLNPRTGCTATLQIWQNGKGSVCVQTIDNVAGYLAHSKLSQKPSIAEVRKCQLLQTILNLHTLRKQAAQDAFEERQEQQMAKKAAA